MDWLIAHPAIALAIFMLLEKIVYLSPAKWDDVVVDGLKTLFGIKRKQQENS